MTWVSFWIVLAVCALAMLIFRVAPLFLVGSQELDPKVEQALNFVPIAAFSALVANDLIPSMEAMTTHNPIDLVLPIAAAVPTIIVARKTRSLSWCIITGVGVFAALYAARHIWLAGM